jgi:dienelactone hydrolase
MFRDVVTRDTTPEDWPALRKRVYDRVMSSMGTPPDITVEPTYEVVEEFERYGLRHRKVRYPVMPDDHGLAIVVLPEGVDDARPAPAVVICHGTNDKRGKDSVMDLQCVDRAYTIELAQRGFVTVAPDCYEFGERLTHGKDLPDQEVHRLYVGSMERFLKEHPEWSLDGRRNWDHQRLLDVLGTMPFVQAGGYGVMGNSLGGRSAIFLAAVDERIAAAVPSCGISPNITNVYRSVKGSAASQASPLWIDYFLKHGGKMLYEYEDMIALCAPRPLLVLEPFNDAYNPYVEANFRCYVAGQRAYQLLGKPECFCTLTHGDGHDTVPDVRDFAYSWFERWLGKPAGD